MRTTSSIAALHRGHDMLELVLGSDILLRRLKFGTRHKHNVGKRAKFSLSVFSLGVPVSRVTFAHWRELT